MRGFGTRHSHASSRSRAARAASRTLPRLLETRPSRVVGEGRMPDGVGKVDHLTLEDRSQSPVPPPVVGHEPHVGAEAYAARRDVPDSAGSTRESLRSQPVPRPTAVRAMGGPSGRSATHGGLQHGDSEQPCLHEGGELPHGEKFRITYATMSADNEELQAALRRGRTSGSRPSSARTYPVIVNGEERGARARYEEPLADRQRHRDRALLAGHARQDVEDAVAAAKAFALEWDRMGWQERVRILRNVAPTSWKSGCSTSRR